MKDRERVANSMSTAFIGQRWDAAAYAEKGRFVADLAGGVVELLAAQAGEAILDLGCGDGALTERIAASGAVMTGVDSRTSGQRRGAAVRFQRQVRCGLFQRRAALDAQR